MNLELSYFSIDHFIYLKSTASTNEYHTNVSSISNPNHNYCIYTFNQTDGRGQIGRKWHTGQEKNIATSFYIKLYNFAIQDQFKINTAVCLALFDTISHFLNSEKIKIKWPNDIYINNEKVAGILIQNQIKGPYITSTTIGIGINVDSQEFPKNIPNPTFINKYLDNNKVNKLNLMLLLSSNLTRRLNIINLNNDKSDYINNLYRFDEMHQYISNIDGAFIGKIVNVSKSGHLIIKTQSELKKFSFREIQYII